MAKITEDVLREYITFCERRFGVRFVEKSSSRFMKLISWILFFNKSFMTSYVTTIATTVYWPNCEDRWSNNPNGSFYTAFHEAQHAQDYKKYRLFFFVSYLMPQLLAYFAVFALLAISVTNYTLFFLLALIFLAPLPAYFRMIWEVRGNACGIATDVWTRGSVSDSNYEARASRFTGPDYYFMWPFRKDVLRRLRREEQKVREGKLTDVQQATYEFLTERGIVAH